jgi:hypothetical protein
VLPARWMGIDLGRMENSGNVLVVDLLCISLVNAKVLRAKTFGRT